MTHSSPQGRHSSVSPMWTIALIALALALVLLLPYAVEATGHAAQAIVDTLVSGCRNATQGRAQCF